MTVEGWRPDPYGRYARRYHDGTSWTEMVEDALGNAAEDPVSTPPPGGPSDEVPRGASHATRPAAVAAAGGFAMLGVVLLVVGLFVFDWLSGEGAGASLSDIRTAIGDDDLGLNAVTEAYVQWGWAVSLAAGALGVVAASVAILRLPALLIGLVSVAWAGEAMVQLERDLAGSHLAIGAAATGLGALAVVAATFRG